MTNTTTRFAFLALISMWITAAHGSEPDQLRTWTDATGKFRTDARFIDLKDGKVRLQKADGGTISIPIERLSEQDQEYAKSRVPPATEEVTPTPASPSTQPQEDLKRDPEPPQPPATDMSPSSATATEASLPGGNDHGSPQAKATANASVTPVASPMRGSSSYGTAAVIAVSLLALAVTSGILVRWRAGRKRHQGLDDPRVSEAVSALMSNVTLSPEMNRVEGTGSEGPVIQSSILLKQLHEAYPDSAELHFAWAAALQVALQGETAAKVLEDCVREHPNFWFAKATQRQNALQTWNPFFLPEFIPKLGSQVHPVIHRIVSTNILLATRQGVLPRAVVFLRDASGEFAPSKLASCKIEFVTTISEVKTPQVVAINGRIHDDPSNPYQCEITQCPIRPFGNKERLPYELFIRQATYDFVVLDSAGRVKYIRQMKPSSRMKTAHARLVKMLETTDGPELSTNEILGAIRRHQSIFDPKKVAY